MAQLPIEQRILLALEIAALIALVIRLWFAKLHRVYAWFFGFLILELFQSVIPLVVPIAGHLYRDLFVASEALLVIVEILVVMELYSKVLGVLPGIADVARRYMRIAIVIAVIAAALPFPMERAATALTDYLFLFERIVTLLLIVFLLLISGFLVYYPVPLGRNVVVYLAGYAALFLTMATASFLNNLGYFWIRMLGSVNMSVFVVCLSFWLLMLNRQGEAKQVVVGHQWNPADEPRLISQLEAINASLLKSTRKSAPHTQ